MCGICGFTGAEGNSGDWATLGAMCDAMAHRGPDGEGLYIADGIALGHRRLSLIDLAGGGQPMVRESSSFDSRVSTPAVAFDHVRGDDAPDAPSAMEAPRAEAGEPRAVAAVRDQRACEAPCEPLAPEALRASCVSGAPRRANGKPALLERGRWSIVFNGEIYNYRELRAELQAHGYRFSTDSDTEVLLVGYIAWREEVLQRLRGMFAFAIYDAQSRDLFCARDFFGIKPFYYTVQGGRFVFASEIKSILEHPAYERQLNEEALAHYLCFQFSALHETFFADVFKLMPGHFLRVGADGSVQVTRYWKPSLHPEEHMGEREAVDAIDRVMRDSVRYHNVADVEVGSFLSSGIDSSYLAACLAGENPAIKTFTVGFAEYSGERDEVSWAKELAARIGVENDARHISEEEFWEALPRVQWHMDEPSADPSAVALYFVDQLAARRVKAVLSGEGADEFFGGYRIYETPLANEHVNKVPKPLLRAGSKVLRAAGRRGANYLERASEQVRDWYYTNANGVAFTLEERQRVLAASVRGRLAKTLHDSGACGAIGLESASADAPMHSADARSGTTHPDGETLPAEDGHMSTGLLAPQQLAAPVYDEAAGLDEVAQMQYVDLWFWLVGDILLKTDKMSMAHSLESRVPFLDREVFEVAAGIPTSLKVSESQTKIALREAAKRAIPRDWAEKQKLGFPVPLASWLRDPKRCEQVRQAFDSAEARRFFDTAELLRLLQEHQAGADNSRRIWIVYSFLVWYRVYFVDCAKPQGF